MAEKGVGRVFASQKVLAKGNWHVGEVSGTPSQPTIPLAIVLQENQPHIPLVMCSFYPKMLKVNKNLMPENDCRMERRTGRYMND